METLAEHGMTGTTTALVAERAGLSSGIISLHFGTKDNLLSATLETLVEAHREKWYGALVGEARDPAARLWAMIESHFDPEICTARNISVWFAFFGERQHRETYRRISGGFDEERNRLAAESCHRIIEEGGYDGLDPRVIAYLIENAADGIWLEFALYPEEIDLDEAKRRMWSLMRTCFPRHFGPVPGSVPGPVPDPVPGRLTQLQHER